jgi:hypothetical protein
MAEAGNSQAPNNRPPLEKGSNGTNSVPQLSSPWVLEIAVPKTNAEDNAPTNTGAATVDLAPTSDGEDIEIISRAEVVLTPLESGSEWSTLAKELLTPEFLTQLGQVLRAQSPLPELVTLQLFHHLLSIYKDKVAAMVQQQGLEAIDTSLPHFKIRGDRPEKSGKSKSGSAKARTLELVFDHGKIKAYLRTSLAKFFDETGIWDEFAKAVGANLIVWIIEDLETQIGTSALHELSASDLHQSVQQSLQNLQTSTLGERIDLLGEIYSQDITSNIVESFGLPSCTLSDLEKLLGLRRRLSRRATSRLDFPAVTTLPTSIPIASSIRAQLRPDLWAQDANRAAVFQYRSKSNPQNYIEHYITNPGDIALLPWEAAEQIINKFGFDTVKLQLIFAARAMEEEEPWKTTFTLRATDIIKLLGWDRNHSTSLPDKRNAIASTAYALSCLLVKSVWIEGYGRRTVDASTPIGRMWDVLIEPHGQFDWVTGKIEKPDEVYITVSPGLWTKNFLNRAGSKAKAALHQFGYLAKDILRIDPYHNELALRLAIQLTLDARIRVRNRNPYDYQVKTLLDEVLVKSQIDPALQDKHRARDLKNRWNSALNLLVSLGWQIEYDPETYPDWLRPGSQAPKPPNWRRKKMIEWLLQAKLTIKPPHPIPELLGRVKEPRPKPKPTPDLPAAIAELTGEQIRQGRERQGWSRKELGGFLNLSADYIGKLERGDRFITPELEKKLRKLLRLAS